MRLAIIVSKKMHISLALVFLACLAILPAGKVQAQVTGLNDWTLYIDQGHSQIENMGVFGYSEAEKVLRVGLALREYLLNNTDIEAVYVARETDQDNISLGARVDQANSLGVDFYYSIHSDAGPADANRTLMLYGGWRSNGVTVEKTPQGGAAYGGLLNIDLPAAMRIPTSGNFADRVFYQGAVYHHENQWPYLYVNRVSNMASLLSEGGFHTNPTQNQRNMNAEWKKLEALAAFWSFLAFHEVEKPAIGVATGIIRDFETQKPLNGITVTIGDQVYVTDTYESLFNIYSNDPNQLGNGFYFFEGLEPLSTVDVVFSSDDYQPYETTLVVASNPEGNMSQNLSFLDVVLTSALPPVVEWVEPAPPIENLVPGTPIRIKFSRKMNQQSVEDAISTSPEATLSFSWQNEFTVLVNTSQLEYVTDYVMTIDGDVAQNLVTGQFLDGNDDGEEGGNYVLELTTSEEDSTPPQLIAFSPSENEPARVLRPIIRLLYDEPIIESSITTDAITLAPANGGENVQGVIHHKVVNGQSILQFLPTANLDPSLAYEVMVEAGLSDQFNNITEAMSFRFYLIEQPITQLTIIDSFDAGIVNWWHPQQAGQTTGIVTELTGRYHDINVVNHTTGSTGSMRLDYAWVEDFAGTPYIRQYLPPTASQNNNRFNIDDVLQVYVFGDGSGNELRLMIRDGMNHLEGSSWITVDWVGWKLISWDLANDPVFGWVNGNGILEGQNFYIDGFHYSYTNGALLQGSIYFDDLRFVKRDELEFPITFFESFEDFEDFTTDLFPWKTVDVQGVITFNPAGFTFPGSGTAYAFKVMNPAMTTGPIIDQHPAVDGDKYLIAMQSQIIGDNKWLISPQILATEGSLLKFHAKSISDQWGLERFRVLVLADNNPVFSFNPEDFDLISEGPYIEAPLDWTQYSFFLGDYAGQVIRFAIQYVSHDSYMFMLDKVEVVQQAATIASITPAEDISVAYGTAENRVIDELQPSTTIIDSFGNSHLVSLSWTIADYDMLTPGDYIATGTFALPQGVNQTNPETPLQLTATVSLRRPFLVNIKPVAPVQVAYGTLIEDVIMVLEQTTILFTNYAPLEFTVELNWTVANYDAFTVDDYLATGTFELPEELDQPSTPLELKVTTTVTVMEDDTSIGETVLESIRIFPNPARDRLTITSPDVIKLVQIFSIDGKLILTNEPLDSTCQISLSGIEQGIYLIRILSGNQLNQKMLQITN